MRGRGILGVCAALALLVPASAPAQSPFARAAAVRDVDASCLTRGADRGRVVLDVAVRYADAAEPAGFTGHRTRTGIVVRGAGGAVLARDTDRGTAQVDIPSLEGYTHVHRHVLSASESRRVLGGRACGDGRDRFVRMRVRATQTLSRGGGGAAASGLRAAAAQSGGATQGDTATVATSVAPATGIPEVINGCVRAVNDWNCQGVDLDGVDLSGSIVAYGDFSFASMENADLQGARMGHVIMNQTKLDGGNLAGALLGSASLTSTSLVGADLTGAVATFANLANAKLTGAKLAGAKLGGANLPGTVFDNATCDAATAFSGAFPHRCVNGLVVAG
jgi:hypothetical protein